MSCTVLPVRRSPARRTATCALLLLAGLAVSCQDDPPRPTPTTPKHTTAATPTATVAEASLPWLPAGVVEQSSHTATDAQRSSISTRLGGTITALTNSHLVVHGSPIQVNLIRTIDADAAEAVHGSLLAIKREPFCLRRGLMIIEYVGPDIDEALAIKTSYELGYLPKPSRLRYRVIARLATIETADYMACNPLFNLFLADSARPGGPAAGEIRKLAAGFRFSRSLSLRAASLAPTATNYEFEPSAGERSADGHRLVVSFPRTPARHGVPFVTATIEITVDNTGLADSDVAPGPRLTAATAAWPSDSSDIKALTHRITQGRMTNKDKADAILDWLAPGKNIRYSGRSGSRWGTLKVIHQKSGHCWDFSDCFVTLCRAADVPARQVAGWLYGSSGHVWAEYYTDQQRWQQVDPTGGGRLACGIYHIPYFTSEDGEMPIVYLAMPTIEVIPDK